MKKYETEREKENSNFLSVHCISMKLKGYQNMEKNVVLMQILKIGSIFTVASPNQVWSTRTQFHLYYFTKLDGVKEPKGPTYWTKIPRYQFISKKINLLI